MDADSPDDVLAIAAGGGNHRAAAIIVRRYTPKVRSRILQWIGPVDIDDHIQNTFIRLFEQLPRLREPSALRGFLVGITLRIACTELRRRRRSRTQLTATGDLPEPRVTSNESEPAREALWRFESILDRLAPSSRRVFVLRYVEKLELTDIAEEMGISVATVKRHFARAATAVSAMVKREPALADYLPIGADATEDEISGSGADSEAPTSPLPPAMGTRAANETELPPEKTCPPPRLTVPVARSARPSARSGSRPEKRHAHHHGRPKKLGRRELDWSPSCKRTGAMSYARVEGCKMHWAELGQGPPLVLLHGLCDSHRTWLKVAPILARTRRVFLLDLAGHGLSERPDASYALAWHARVVGAWLGALGLENVDLVGHSYGGGVALWMMLLEHRARVRTLSLVAAGGLGRDVCVPLRLASIPVVVERFGQAFMGRGTRLALNSMGGAYDHEESARLSAMNATAGTARAFARSVRDVIDWRGQHRHVLDGAGELGPLPPVALFWGDRDPVIPIAHATASASLLGGAPITRFPGCGHFPHRERPAEFAAALESFLRASNDLGHLRSAA